jgi:hypothetical protein
MMGDPLLEICVECNPDEKLVHALGFKVKHCGGASRVTRYLNAHDNSVGMIDEDPGKSHSKNFFLFKEHSSQHDIIVSKWEGRRLILLQPEIEDWILRTAKLEHVDPSEFGLPRNADELRKVINYRLNKWEQLVIVLSKSERMKYLKKMLSNKD